MRKRVASIKSFAIGGGRVWLFPLAECCESELLLRACLTPEELIIFNNFQPTQIQRRAEWLASRVLVWEQLQGRIGYASSGQPILIFKKTANGSTDPAFDDSLISSDRYISISHTVGWVAMMTSSNGPCGIDIEPADRNAERIASRIASTEELALIAPIFPANPPLALWCAKEAAYKAIGSEGLDFKNDIHLTGVTAQTLHLVVKTKSMTLDFFKSNEIIGTCGTFQSRM